MAKKTRGAKSKAKEGEAMDAISDPQTRVTKGVQIVGGGDPAALRAPTEGVRIVQRHH